MRKYLLLTLLALPLLGGCMSLPADPSKMSAEQLKEWVKDKNATVGCVIANTPYGRGVGVFVNMDKGIVPNGALSVDSECKISIQNATPAK